MIQLYHNLDASNPEAFTSRGNITVLSINQGDVQVNQKDLTQKDRQMIAELAKKNRFYRLKADVVGTDGVKTTFMTSSKACLLIYSQLHDLLTVSFDHSPTVVAISYKAVNLDPVPDTCETVSNSEIEQLQEFSSVVSLKTMEPAPVPDTAGFIQKVEKERESRERGDVVDNRSFIQKYWMYIVPAVILLLISGITNPEAQAGAGAGGQ